MAKKVKSKPVNLKIRKGWAKVAGITVPVILSLGLAYSFVFGPEMAQSCNSDAVKPPKDNSYIDTIPEDLISSSTEPSYTEETVDFEDDNISTIEPETNYTNKPDTLPSTPDVIPTPDINGGASNPDTETSTEISTEPNTDADIPIEEVGLTLAEILQTLTDNIRETNSNPTIVVDSIHNMTITPDTTNEDKYKLSLLLEGTLGKTTTKKSYFIMPVESSAESADELYSRLTDSAMTTAEYIKLLGEVVTSNETSFGVSTARDKIEITDESTVAKKLLLIRKNELLKNPNAEELALLNKIILYPDKANVQVFDARWDKTTPGFEYTSNVILNFGNYSYEFQIRTSFANQPTADELKNAIRSILYGDATSDYVVETTFVDNTIYAELLGKLNENTYQR